MEKISSVEAMKACLGRIEKTKHLNALTHTAAEQALDAAAAADKKKAAGQHSALLGVPVVLKDNIAVRGMPMTCGSKMLHNFMPPYDAAVTTKLKSAGAVILGKSNMDEFSLGTSGETSFYGAAKNPLDATRTAGGSSGGSAAAVAAGQCFGALGTDTGGSVRLPASFCGLVGLKPTPGSISLEGIMPMASALDTVGIFAKTVADSALILSAISDADTQKIPKYELKGKKIALLKEFRAVKTDGAVSDAFGKAAAFFESGGARVDEAGLPYTDALFGAYLILTSGEFSTNMGRFDGIKYGYRARGAADVASLYETTRTEGFGDEVKKRILFGNFVLGEQNYQKYFVKAQKVRALITARMKEIFKKFDAVIAPTAPSVAFALGQKDASAEKRNADAFLTLANLAGLPAVSVPCKTKGLPIGLQIIMAPNKERELLGLAAAFEGGQA
jgi:aspartyl-tRNA(Asn)/glutamyl-tRNA(Gln) amidotransferase subunit A